MKISLKGVSNFPTQTNVRSSYGGNLSSRPGTSHRLMASGNYNTIGASSTKNNKTNVSKAATSMGQAQVSPSRLSSRKKTYMEWMKICWLTILLSIEFNFWFHFDLNSGGVANSYNVIIKRNEELLTLHTPTTYFIIINECVVCFIKPRFRNYYDFYRRE